MYVKNIIKILTIFSITLINSPQKVYAQIYDEKIIPEYYYRSFNNLPAIRQAFQYLDEINSPEAPHISVPISAIVDLRLLELPQELAKEYNAHLERYNYIYSDKKSAIQAIEKIFEIRRLPLIFELAGVISLAIITHNDQDYLRSIKYVNWWHSFRPTKRHQLYYLLADNYLKIGDRKNAFSSFQIAEEIWKQYISGGIDMRDEMGIEDYSAMISNLKSNFELENGSDIQNDVINVDIPPITDESWVVKITPDFPRAALRKGRTGYVIVKFDVTRLGNPENITFVETSNSLFRRPANKFLENMKYIQYEVPNVEKYISTDVTYRIDFNFEN